MRWVYRRQIPSWNLYPRLIDLCMVDSNRRMRYSTNEPFNPDLFRVYSPRWVAFTTAKESHLPPWYRWYCLQVNSSRQKNGIINLA